MSNVLLHAPHVGSKKKVPKFEVDDLEGTLHFIPDHEPDKDGKPTATVRQYVVGFTLVPPWIMRGGLARFVLCTTSTVCALCTHFGGHSFLSADQMYSLKIGRNQTYSL